LISTLVEHADRRYPMPWSVIGARLAENWSETSFGLDFVYMQDVDGGSRVRHVGFAQIEQQSQSANPSTTGIVAKQYLRLMYGCLIHARDIANKLAIEAPPRLFTDTVAAPPSPSPTPDVSPASGQDEPT
jgi:hypothetical protein